jgi:hypothetical protein
MKYLKNLDEHNAYAAFIVGKDFTNAIHTNAVISYCKLEKHVHYNKYIPSYNVLDILYANANGKKKVDSAILDPSLGYTPIGICIAKTGFFGANEKARWMSLKYMNYTTPETGSLTAQSMDWGNYGTDLNMIPNIQTTHNGGTSNGYFTVDYYDSSSRANKIPSIFNENNEWNTSVLGAANQYAVTDIQGREKTDLILASATSQSTWMTDTSITNESGAGYAPAACCCTRYHTVGTEAGDWYLGASGEMCMIIVQKTAINAKLAQIAAVYTKDSISLLANGNYWSSTEYNSSNANFVNATFCYIGNNGKSNGSYVVAMLAY